MEAALSIPTDPLADGVTSFGHRLRRGEITAESATRDYLARIDALDPQTGAYQYVAHDTALAQARSIDALQQNGFDLGPLMGVPVAVKDLFAVSGMPTTAGSALDVTDLIGPEGWFVKRLRQLGCVIIGKTRTVEFAFGVTGASAPRGTPHNPADKETPRAPGGSSSGSAAAVAAGLCGFAIGSDTGGSVRIPAALCGVFGLKTSHGLWPTDGVFPLAPHLDTIGLLTRSAADAAAIHAALEGSSTAAPASLRGLRLCRPGPYFFDNLDPDVSRLVEGALGHLAETGCVIDEAALPEPRAREDYFPLVLAASLVAALGEERIHEGRSLIDPLVSKRIDVGLNARAVDLLSLERKRDGLRAAARDLASDLDAWVSPTSAILAPPLAELDDPSRAMSLTLGMTQNTQPGNYLDLCGATLPLHGAGLPVGLQLLASPQGEQRLLSICCAIEDALNQVR